MPPGVPEEESREAPNSTLRNCRELLAGGLRTGVAWARANRLKAGLLVGVCLLSVGGVIALWLGTAVMTWADEDVSLDMALEALDRGEYLEARRIAETLRSQGTFQADALGGPTFVLGAAAACEAEDSWSTNKKSLYLISARYLEEACDLGFPPDRQGEGLFLLGRALYQSGQIPSSRLVLREALKVDPQRKTEIYRLLADAYLNDANPKCREALDCNTRYLADRTLPTAERHQAVLQRAEILLQLDNVEECLSTLDEIPADAKHRADALVMRGRVLIHEARALNKAPDASNDPDAPNTPDTSEAPMAPEPLEAAGESQVKAFERYQAAITSLRLAQDHDTLSTQADRRATYLIGVCLLETGDERAALNQFGRTSRAYIGTPEALAATLQVAEISLRQGRDRAALAAYRQVLREVTDPTNYSNPWLPLDELRRRMLEAYQHYSDAEDSETCLQLTRSFYPVFPRSRMLELTAETHRTWGRRLLAQADHLPLSQAGPLGSQGREQLRRAGHVYALLAKFRASTRHYPDDLWNSAQDYLAGHDYRNTVEILDLYLRNESRRRRPRALTSLGEAMLALGRVDEALQVFQECIQFHLRDAATFDARLGASSACLEKGDIAQAEKFLQENLDGDFLAPTSEEWSESLFRLGRLLHTDGRYEEAILSLDEAVSRYGDSPQATEAQYLLADSCRKCAKLVEEKSREELVENARLACLRKAHEFLQSALEGYRQARQTLGEHQQTAELTPAEKSMLRNCYFFTGSILLDLGEYDAAIQAYSTAINRYQNVPEVLEAYVQIARAYRQLGKPDDARGTLEQAKLVLSRMKPAAGFDQTTNYNEEEWSHRLDWLATL